MNHFWKHLTNKEVKLGALFSEIIYKELSPPINVIKLKGFTRDIGVSFFCYIAGNI